jgi:predicted exporter
MFKSKAMKALIAGLTAKQTAAQTLINKEGVTAAELTAASDEIATIQAKIKAQEQVVNPQIAQLNKDYSRRVKETTASFDAELESLEKLKEKTQKLIDKNIVEGKGYVVEAKAQAAKGHKIYERRWKAKIKAAKKELESLKKELLFCGTKSGRDVDKFKECNLKLQAGKSVNTPVVADCDIQYECRIVYKQEMNPELLDEAVKKSSYRNEDYHTIYYGEIVNCYMK